MTDDEYNAPLIEVYHAAMRAMNAGKAKYPDPTWRDVSVIDHFAALQRHLEMWIRSPSDDKADATTGLSHLDHAAARLAFLLVMEKENIDGAVGPEA